MCSSSSSMNMDMEMKEESRRINYKNILQVFSVSIQMNDDKILGPPVNLTICPNGSLDATLLSSSDDNKNKKSVKVYGRILVRDAVTRETLIYQQHKNNPQVVSLGDTLSLIHDSTWCPLCFGTLILFDLYEADTDLEISRGFFYFDYNIPNHDNYFDKRLSALVRGQHGSATIFYTLFQRAIQATLSAKLLLLVTNNNPWPSCCCVYGCVFVRYAGHDYSSDYHKLHYRSLVFKRLPSNAIPFDAVDALLLPLAIPMVGVPQGSSLIIEADLRVSSGGTEIATLRADTDFSLPHQLGADSKTVCGNNTKLEVMVTWSDFY